jgi:integrase
MPQKGRASVKKQSGSSVLFGEVIKLYMASSQYAGLEQSTREGYSRYLAVADTVLGKMPVSDIGPPEIQELLDGFEAAGKLGAGARLQVALKSVERWAIVRRHIPHAITLGTTITRSGGGHRPWTDEQVATAERHGRLPIARLVTLAANTGQRGSDLCRMRWTDLETNGGCLGINVIQRKTGLALWIPFSRELANAIQTWERRPGFILIKANGQPWESRHQLSAAWERERDGNPALEPCRGLVLHGLRATAVVRLRRAGATTPQIVDMVGLSAPMVERYSRFADQKQSALAAVYKLDGTRTEHYGSEESPPKKMG